MAFEAIRLQSWYGTPQGDSVVRIIGAVMERWLSGRHVESTLGLGFTQPYLGLAQEWTDALFGIAPAEMGVARWPPGKGNRIALARPDALPFPDAEFDRVIMTHLLEGADSPHATLRETWRILSPGGRLLVVVPNRRGFWARHDGTPFGWGRPFSPRQLQEQLEEALFIPRQAGYALFLPPWLGKRGVGLARSLEKIGNRWFPVVGGVIVCEAEKVVVASTPLRSYTEQLERRGKLALPAVESGRSMKNIGEDA
ncbi:MAG: methyltransferase domain-containing protein [Magnetococcales bacterium]|nr:methyltransferase domain-containing protein [Magnetococcales bacterium]